MIVGDDYNFSSYFSNYEAVCFTISFEYIESASLVYRIPSPMPKSKQSFMKSYLSFTQSF